MSLYLSTITEQTSVFNKSWEIVIFVCYEKWNYVACGDNDNFVMIILQLSHAIV